MMKMISRRDALLVAAALLAAPAFAQSAYPDHNLRIIVPQTAGGPSDVLGRVFAQKLSERLGKPVIVENKPGAGANIGTDMVAKSKPDGYTLLINIAGILAINETLYKQLPFDAVRDLDGVARVVTSQLALVAHPSFAPNNIRELVAYAKARPAGSISYGSAGTGSPQHIGGELLNTKAGIKLNHIPYKGAAQYTIDLIAGHIELAIIQFAGCAPLANQGKVRALGATSLKRTPILPNLPTIAEQGLAGFESYNWNGVLAPAGTPRAIILRIHEILARQLATPEGRELFVSQGHEPGGDGPDEYAAFIRAEIEKWSKVAKAAGIQAQ
jgi:tripartite-type tricarboxylate transporter receptor subunit TctC